MTEQEYMQEQARLRAIINQYRDARGESHVFLREAAQKRLEALVEHYRREYPPLEGIYTYTKEEAEEARRHGF